MALSRNQLILVMFLALLLVPGGRVLSAQTTLRPAEESRIWIEGRSNINQFECNAQQYDGEAIIRDSLLTQPQMPEDTYRRSSADFGTVTTVTQSQQPIELQVEIQVAGFECGRQRMNRDLTNALKADQHPLITFELHTVSSTQQDSATVANYQLQLTGLLTVAGTSNNIDLLATGEILNSGQLRARGEKSIRMTDYNVEPPSGLFGLVQAEDELTVHFDLYSRIDGD